MALRIALIKMKLVKIAYLIVVAVALTVAAVGCRKGLDKTTNIPKGASGTVGGDNAAPARDLPPSNPNLANTPPPTTTTTPPDATTLPPPVNKTDSGIAQSEGDFTGWNENRDEFKNQTVYFDYDKSNVKPGEVKKLEEVAKRMKASFAGKALRVEGHCDERGTEEYNRALGDRRALSVREKLVELGLDPKMIPTISYGEEKPTDPGHSEAAWSKNRRGELILLTKPGGNP